jgi:putative CocE/NonD family hydrolase
VAPTGPRTFYLARERTGPGRLVTKAPSLEGGTTSFVSDPANPVTDPFANLVGAHDYRELPKRADTASFESEPFDTDVTVVGAMRAEIHVSADAPDLDLWVKVYDVAPDGAAFNLMSPGLDVQRASTRDGSLTPRFLKKGEVVVLEFANLYTGNRFLKGHRLRVVLTPEFSPHFSRNLHSGERETTSADMRKARITIHHGSDHPSRLVLPVLP